MMAWETSLAEVVCERHERACIALGSRRVCPACLEERAEPWRARHGRMAAHFEREDLERRMRDARIPSRYQDARFETLRLRDGSEAAMGRLYGAMERYCEGFATYRERRTGFLFVGAPGTGKTHLACAMIRALVEKGFAARYLSMPAFTHEVRAAYKDRAQTTQGLIEPCVRVDFLVVDEIDLHGASEADYQLLYEIVNARYIAGRHPVLALSNRSREYLMKDLNERIVSRILGEHPENAFNWPTFR